MRRFSVVLIWLSCANRHGQRIDATWKSSEFNRESEQLSARLPRCAEEEDHEAEPEAALILLS
jgi:hypothetical protein